MQRTKYGTRISVYIKFSIKKTNNTMKTINKLYIAAFAALSIAFSANAQVKIGSNPTTITANTNLEVEATDAQKVVVSKDKGYVGIGIATPSYKAHTIELNSPNVFTSLIENKQTNAVTQNDIIAARGLVNFTGGFSGAGSAAGHSGELSFGGSANYTNGSAAYNTAYNTGSGSTNSLVGTTSNVFSFASGTLKLGMGQNVAVDGNNNILQEAIGINLRVVTASGTDASNPHKAYGIKIENNISAVGGSTNKAWSIYSESTQPSYYAGNVGIGVTNPIRELTVNGVMRQFNNPIGWVGGTQTEASPTSGWNIALINKSWQDAGFNGLTKKDDAGLFYSDGNEGTAHGFTLGAWDSATGKGLRIDGNGNVGVGVSSPSEKLHVAGNILASGTITPSDARYKENIATLGGSLAKLTQLRGVSYTHKAEFIKSRNLREGNQIGFIAQELEAIFPEFVVTSSDGYKAVDYSRLTPVLVESLKEVNAKLEAQQARILELEAQQAEINELKALVKQLLEKK
jgi:hypothetical protein